MKKIVKYADIKMKEKESDPKGALLPDLGRYRLHAVEVFHLLNTSTDLYYYEDLLDCEEYMNIYNKFNLTEIAYSPAVDYEYGNHRNSIKLGTVDDKKALLIEAHDFREMYVDSGYSIRRIYIDENYSLNLEDVSDLVYTTATNLNIDGISSAASYNEDLERLHLDEYIYTPKIKEGK